jgi:hypothetical protein
MEYLLPVVVAEATTHIRAQQVVQVAAVAKTSIIRQRQVLPVKEMLAEYRIVIGTVAVAAVAVRQPPDKTADLMLVLLSVLVRHQVVQISTPQLAAKAGTGFRPQFLEAQWHTVAVVAAEWTPILEQQPVVDSAVLAAVALVHGVIVVMERLEQMA